MKTKSTMNSFEPSEIMAYYDLSDEQYDSLDDLAHYGLWMKMQPVYNAAPELLEANIYSNSEIGKHMAAIEAGEYTYATIVEILVDIQNRNRAAIAKATE